MTQRIIGRECDGFGLDDEFLDGLAVDDRSDLDGRGIPISRVHIEGGATETKE